MPHDTPRVIRSDEVKLAGRRRIGCGAQTDAPRQGPASAGARIFAEDASGATLEVVCSCGKRTYVRCDYRRSPSQPAAGEQLAAGATESQENQS